ncbi:MAG: hypothetical protein ACREVO_02180 [Steroidobacteraceae bacterium]
MLRVTAIRRFLHLGPLQALQVLLCVAAAVARLATLQGVKLLVRRA